MNKKLLKTAYAALFAALIFVGTQFVRIPLPFGYFNFGDCFIILSSMIIGAPYSMAASAVGAVLSDMISGYTAYAPATLIIKPLMVVALTMITKIGANKIKKIKTLLMATGAIAAELIMVSGYFIYDTVIYGFAGAVTALPGNIIQGIVAVVASMVIITVFEHSGLLKFFKLK